MKNVFRRGAVIYAYSIGYPIIKHATLPFPDEKAQYASEDHSAIPCLKVLGLAHGRRRPHRPQSVLYVSAMSFGSLFVERVAERTGLPVGIKSAVGEMQFWKDLAERIKTRAEGPDFIAIDGKEGGSGASPLTWSDHVALPFKIGFGRVYELFQMQGIASDVVWVGAGKLGFPDRAVVAFAMGCDMVAMARESMLAIGCIQAQRCHTGNCPAGIATMGRWLQAGIDVPEKAERFTRFVRGFRKELLALSHTAGYEHPGQFEPDDIELSTGVNRFSTLDQVLGYRKDSVPFPGMLELRPSRTEAAEH